MPRELFNPFGRFRVHGDRANISADSVLQYKSSQWVPRTLTELITDLTEAIQDLVGAMVSGGTETGISVTYDDTNGRFNFVVDADYSTPIGTVVPYAGTTEPNSNWLFCYGQNVSRTTYATLFARLSTTYGAGDGSTTFGLPDLRGRVVAGQDDMGGVSANRLTGITGSVNGDTLGGTGGEEGHAITAAEMDAHTHDVNPAATASGNASVDHTHTAAGTTGNANTGHDHGFSGNDATNTTTGGGGSRITALSDGLAGAQDRNTASGGSAHTHSFSDTTTGHSVTHTHTTDIANTTSTSVGSNTAHNTVQPTIILNYMIRAL